MGACPPSGRPLRPGVSAASPFGPVLGKDRLPRHPGLGDGGPVGGEHQGVEQAGRRRTGQGIDARIEHPCVGPRAHGQALAGPARGPATAVQHALEEPLRGRCLAELRCRRHVAPAQRQALAVLE